MIVNYLLYHGTSYKNFCNIRKSGKFICNHRLDYWLGNGIYFFINDKYSAKWWANSNKKLKHDDKCIIYFNLEIERKNILDLNSLEDYKKLETFRKELDANNLIAPIDADEKAYIEKQKNKKETERHILLSKLLKMYLEYDNNIKAICYAFEWHLGNYDNGLLGLPRQNQINILEKYQSIIDIDKLKCDKI